MDIRLVITKSVAIIIAVLLISSSMLIPQIIDLPLFLSASITMSIAIFWAFFGKSTIRAIQTPLEKKWIKDQYDADKALNKLTRDLSPVNTRGEAFECVARLIQNTIEIRKIDAVIFFDNEEAPLVRYQFNFNKDKERVEIEEEDSPKLSLITSDICPVERLHIEERKVVHGFGYDEQALLFPVQSSASFEGYLLIGSKISEDRYTPKDFQFFETIQNQMLIVLDRIRPYESIKAELETSRQYIEKANQIQAQSQLAMGLSHEIRNPLASIRSGLDALSIDPTVEDLKEFLPIAKRTIDRLTQISENMMQFGKSASHQMVSCNVNEILNDLLYFVKTTLGKTKIHLTLELGEVPSVIGDGSSLAQVFTNLINNAMDEMKEGGEMLIRTEAARFRDKDDVTREGLVVIIRDTGNGIAPENLSRIFDSFYSTKYQGMGLGLSISLKIIDEHKGIIRAESELQKGSTFKVYLPVEIVRGA